MINYDQQIYEGAIKGGTTQALAKLMVAQARHETGNYSNYQTRKNNNVFGFKYSPNSQYSKKGNISPEGDYYAYYQSLEYAILDYIGRWMNMSASGGGTRLQEFNQISDTTSYAIKLKSYGYYGAPVNEYISGLNSALKRMLLVEFYFNNKKTINYAIVGGIIILLTGYIYFLKNKKII